MAPARPHGACARVSCLAASGPCGWHVFSGASGPGRPRCPPSARVWREAFRRQFEPSALTPRMAMSRVPFCLQGFTLDSSGTNPMMLKKVQKRLDGVPEKRKSVQKPQIKRGFLTVFGRMRNIFRHMASSKSFFSSLLGWKRLIAEFDTLGLSNEPNIAS